MSEQKISKPNRGALFRNKNKREGHNDPDYKGEVHVEGIEYWVNSWIQEGKSGKYMSMSLRKKDDMPAKPAPAVVTDDEIPF